MEITFYSKSSVIFNLTVKSKLSFILYLILIVYSMAFDHSINRAIAAPNKSHVHISIWRGETKGRKKKFAPSAFWTKLDPDD